MPTSSGAGGVWVCYQSSMILPETSSSIILVTGGTW